MWQKSSVEEQESTDTRRGLGETSVTLVSSALFFLQCKKDKILHTNVFQSYFFFIKQKAFYTVVLVYFHKLLLQIFRRRFSPWVV